MLPAELQLLGHLIQMDLLIQELGNAAQKCNLTGPEIFQSGCPGLE